MAGVSVEGPAVVPSLEVHIQSGATVTCERNIKSWRLGVADEECKL